MRLSACASAAASAARGRTLQIRPARQRSAGGGRPCSPAQASQAGSSRQQTGGLTKKKAGNGNLVATLRCSRRRQAKLSHRASRAKAALSIGAAAAAALAALRCSCFGSAFLEAVALGRAPAAAPPAAAAAAAFLPSWREKVWRDALTVMSRVAGDAKASPQSATAAKQRASPEARAAERVPQFPPMLLMPASFKEIPAPRSPPSGVQRRMKLYLQRSASRS